MAWLSILGLVHSKDSMPPPSVAQVLETIIGPVFW